MLIMGKHHVSWTGIIELAIHCQALDSVSYCLLHETTIKNTETVNASYQEMLSRYMLMLAISLRTKFYQGANNRGTDSYINHCGFMYRYEDGQEIPFTFTIKDICDKIIHATSIIKYADEENSLFDISGSEWAKKKKVSWNLAFSVPLFAQGVINWALDQEKKKTR